MSAYIGHSIGEPEGWDLRFLNLCKFISTWSKDPSTKVGSVIVDDYNRIISTGFNGLPHGIKDTPERLADRDTKYKMVMHGDANAILFAQRDLHNTKIYTYPFPPCSRCAAMIIQAGIKQVVAPTPSEDVLSRWEDDLAVAVRMYDEAGVDIYLVDFK